MANDRLWFTKRNSRKLILRSAVLLVGKAPAKEKRIKMQLTMPLTGEKVTGFPEWLQDARDFTMKTGDTATCDITIKHANITASDDHLFEKKPTEMPKTTMRNMVVLNMGSEEEPKTVLQFTATCPFGTDIWRFCGAYGGEEFWASFELVAAPESDDEEDEDEDEEGEEPIAKGPKQLSLGKK